MRSESGFRHGDANLAVFLKGLADHAAVRHLPRRAGHPPLLRRQDRHGHPLAVDGWRVRHWRAGGHHHDRDRELYGRRQSPDRARFAQESASRLRNRRGAADKERT